MSGSRASAQVEDVSRETRLYLAEEFIAAFCRCDLERVAQLLTEDFRFDGPLFKASSRAEYMAALEADPPDPRSSYKLLHSVEERGTVLLAYRFTKPAASMLIAERCRFRGDKISELTLVFDGEFAE